MGKPKSDTRHQGRLHTLWSWLKKPLLLGIPIGVFVLLLAIGSFQGVMTLTNQNAFCFSCHLKMDTIVQEYKASDHYMRNGKVIATCADCHVPHDFVDKMKVKIMATADIYYMLAGTITKENFEQHRPELAQKVWDTMEKDNSANCRYCHTGSNFDLTKQPQRAKLNHEQLGKTGKTCIDCHTGIAHKRIVIE
ncbi:NapC/NirT family cytochrome c [Vibrio marisflavi]|uniref:Cytochrome c-type protein n=1 Tax=Vibrio marisflavi CECT 7928 TaxID=634439 RepID=A0ABN8E500_9VIBR|nr:NapC/NirT family cytochrome c [Vibrio marisflavi]CAH0540630.1 Cytochrome c-type protein NapC [Vibrio marisflavi CECT 7928]